MEFSLHRIIEILNKTPDTLEVMLSGIDEAWFFSNEGPETFSPYDVVGHLVHGEKTDYIDRLNLILQHGTSIPFKPFDRFAQFEESKGKTLADLLNEFRALRNKNIDYLRSLNLQEEDFNKKGSHPVLGEVTLRQLLATWAVHDLTHIAQISRVMAKQYKDEVGPWKQFMRVLEF